MGRFCDNPAIIQEALVERRDWLKAVSVTAAAAALPFERVLMAAAETATDGRATIESEVKRLNLRHTWTTTMSSSAYRDTLFVRYTRDGITGVGEGAPIVRYHEDAVGGKKLVDGLADFLAGADPLTFQKINGEILRRVNEEWAAKAAVDIAIL